LKILENSEPIHIVKNEKTCSEWSTKGVTEQQLMDLISYLSRSQEQRYQQRHCQIELKGTEKVRQKVRQLGCLDSIGLHCRAI
jgi:hypothetical protein